MPVTRPTFWVVLAATAVIFWLLPRRWRSDFLLAASLAYLLSLDFRSVIMLGGWSLLFYFIAPLAGPIDAANGGRRRHRAGAILPGLVLAILLYLAAFKYLPEILAQAFGSARLARWAIPLGISYFSFKLIHYAVETFFGSLPRHDLRRFLLWLYLFPIYPAGPIERFDHMLEHQDSRWRLSHLTVGGTRIVVGLIKTFVIGEMLIGGYLVDRPVATMLARATGPAPLPVLDYWSWLACAFLWAYMNFAGYADIAIGGSRLFGIRIMENFNFPFLARNIGNFWQRWHMTLSGWCRTYVYLPAVGLTRNPYLGIYLTFITIGLWHAGTLNWLGWGLYHATGTAVFVTWLRIKRRFRWRWTEAPILRPLAVAMTFAFVSSSYAFLATDSPADAARMLGKLVGVGW